MCMTPDRRTVAGILALLVAAVAVLGAAGCVSLDTGADTDLPLANDGSWYNYDISNSPGFALLQHTYDPKENFYAYANAEEIRKGSGGDILALVMAMMNQGSSKAERIATELKAQFDAVSRDTSLTGREAELVRTVNTMYHDTATREELGVAPVLSAVEEIRAVSTLDELTALISSGGVSSLKEAFVREAATGCLDDARVTTLEIVPQEFALSSLAASAASLYRDMTPDNARLYAYLLGNFHTFLERCGYTPEEADATVAAFKNFEMSLAPACDDGRMSSDAGSIDYRDYYHPYTYEELSAMAFPIAGDLKVYHDAGVTRYSVLLPSWLEKLNELYTPDHLEEFKAAMLYDLFMTATPFLDKELQGMYFDAQVMEVYPLLPAMMQEVVDGMVQSMENLLGGLSSLLNPGEEMPDITASALGGMDTAGIAEELLPVVAETMAEMRLTDEYLGMALGKTIVEKNVPAGEKEKYTELTEAVIAAFRDRLANAGWLSASTRDAALSKLDKVKVRVLYPDDWSYYSYDDVDYLNAASLYDLSVQLRKHNQAEIVRDALQDPSEAVWLKDPAHQVHLLPQTYNAFYNPQDNSINLLYGYVSGLVADSDASYEEILATAGTTIAHELTHGFDPTGSRFDGDGSYVDWWTDDDRRNFAAKEQRIADYFGSFEARPGEYLDGKILTAEAIADFGGLSTVLDIARTTEDFDYDAFFTVYGQNLYQPVMNALYGIYLADVHPPGMYRVNVGVQQYDEFIDTYQVTEENLMYLAPEDRLTIW